MFFGRFIEVKRNIVNILWGKRDNCTQKIWYLCYCMSSHIIQGSSYWCKKCIIWGNSRVNFLWQTCIGMDHIFHFGKRKTACQIHIYSCMHIKWIVLVLAIWLCFRPILSFWKMNKVYKFCHYNSPLYCLYTCIYNVFLQNV